MPPSTRRWVAAKSFLTFRDRRLPPSKASNPSQRLEPAPAPKPLQRLQPFNSSNKKTFHPRAAGWPQSLFLRFRDRRLPPSKASNPSQRLEPALAPKPPQRLQPLNCSNKKILHPRAAGWPQSLFLRCRDRRLPPSKASNPSQRLEPATFSGSCLPSSKAANLRVELCPQYHPL